MGPTQVSLLIVAALAAPAHADECTGTSRRGERFATCFDLGNRLSVTAGSEGLGLTLALRHEITFDDDPDLEWKMEHVLVDSTYAVLDQRFTGTFYRGRFLRHARDGHIVIPLGTPKKVFLPFDIGALFEVGRLDWQPMQPTFAIGVVRVAPLVDFARSRSYRRVFSIGPSMHWDMNVDRSFQAVTEQTVAPFTEGLATVRLESGDGLYVAELRAEAGTAWHSDRGWHPEARAEATFEKIVLAINDRPIALTAGIQYDSVRDETLARLGARFVVFDRTDPRVSLHPLRARAVPAPVHLPRVLPPSPPPPPKPRLDLKPSPVSPAPASIPAAPPASPAAKPPAPPASTPPAPAPRASPSTPPTPPASPAATPPAPPARTRARVARGDTARARATRVPVARARATRVPVRPRPRHARPRRPRPRRAARVPVARARGPDAAHDRSRRPARADACRVAPEADGPVLAWLRVKKAVVLAAVLVAARTAHAIPYETFIDVDDQADLQDLLASNDITQDTFDDLLDLLEQGVDLNTADRAELYTLPNLTYDDVDKIIAYRSLNKGRINDPADLVAAGALTEGQLLAIAAFIVVKAPGENPLSVHGWIKGETRYTIHDRVAPPFAVRARITALRHLTAGIALTTTRLEIGDPQYDPNRDALVADPAKYSAKIPKAYVKWEDDDYTAILGNYRAGFAQRLVFDNSRHYTPNGLYLDDQVYYSSDLTTDCKESAGELLTSPCAGSAGDRYVTPDWVWRDSLFGVGAGVKKLELQTRWIQAYAFASASRRSIYQYELVEHYNPDGTFTAPTRTTTAIRRAARPWSTSAPRGTC